MTYSLYAQKSGVTVNADSKTLEGAKREASKWISFWGGSVSVLDKSGNAICTRKFWQNGNRFGWESWLTH